MEIAVQSSALQLKQLARLRRRLTSEDHCQIHIVALHMCRQALLEKVSWLLTQ